MPDLADLFPGYASEWINTRSGRIFARVGGTSIMGLMMLSAGPGTTITVSATGADAEAAVAALARHSGMIRRHFGIPDHRRVVCGISFGFADHAHKINSYRTSRASVADTVRFVGE